MKISQILTKPLEETKIGKVIFILFLVVIVVLYIISQFSVENRCKRKVYKTMNLFEQVSDHQFSDDVLQNVAEGEIRDCIEKAQNN